MILVLVVLARTTGQYVFAQPSTLNGRSDPGLPETFGWPVGDRLNFKDDVQLLRCLADAAIRPVWTGVTVKAQILNPRPKTLDPTGQPSPEALSFNRQLAAPKPTSAGVLTPPRRCARPGQP